MTAKSNASSRRGVSAVEMALALPLVLLLIMGGLDFALQFHTLHCMNHAARNAARHLAVRDGTPQEATSIALDELSGLHAPFTVSAAQPAPSDPNRDVVVHISVERSEVSLGLFDSGEMQVEVTMRKEDE